jgi:hypothetical protein
MLRFAVLAAVLLLACEPTNEAAQSSVPANPKPAAAVAAGCPNAGPLVSNAYQPPAIANTTASYVRTCDRAGGWSLELPPGWFERSSPQHGREVMSYDPNGMLDNGGSNPPADGVFVRLQMMHNPERSDASAFALSPLNPYRRNVREQRTVTLAGQPAEFYAAPSYWASTETDLFWYLKSPFFADRVVVVTVVRAESPLRAEAERLVTSLRFFQPTAVNLVPSVSRSEIIARVSSRPGLTLTRIEAKLVLRKDLETAGSFRDGYSDPDALAWVVAYAGDGIHRMGSGGPFIPGAVRAPPAPALCLSTVDIYPADGQPAATSSGGCDTKSAWPTWFDALADRGH